MGWKRKVSGGTVAVIGYMLSPLSWWNDMFVNVPLALLFAWLVSLVYRPAFETCLIVGYWLTNVIGLVMIHKGAETVLSTRDKRYTGRDFLRDVGISLLYTGLIVLLLKLKILQPIKYYFKNP
jgi:multisubunit Na+/H+ antiporter MnhG subunit